MIIANLPTQYITDEVIDSMPPAAVSKLLKSILQSIRDEANEDINVGSKPITSEPAPVSHPLSTPKVTTKSTLLDSVNVPDESKVIVSMNRKFDRRPVQSKIDKRKVEVNIPWEGSKQDCPYNGIRYSEKQDTFISRVKQVLIAKRKDPIYVAIMYDFYCDAMNFDTMTHPRNYDNFDEVMEEVIALKDEDKNSMELNVKIKAEKTIGEDNDK